MRRLTRHLVASLLFLTAFSAEAGNCGAQKRAETKRPFIVQDLFTIDELGDVRPSPDGETAAVVIKRHRSPGESYQRSSFWSRVGEHDRDDIWLVDLHGELAPTNLTHGIRNGAGFANPTWSPDSRWLALLSSVDGAFIRLLVWQRGHKTVVPLAQGPIDPSVSFFVDGQPVGPLAWLNPRQVVTVLLDPTSVPKDGAHMMSAAVRGWSEAERGRETTASEIDALQPTVFQREAVVIVDVESGRIDTVAVTEPFALAPAPSPSLGRMVHLSPDHRSAVWIAQSGDVRRHDADRVTPANAMGPLRLGVMVLDHRSKIRWVADLEPSLASGFDGIPAKGEWSSDNRQYALLGARPPSRRDNEVILIDTQSATITEIPFAEMEPQSITWCGASCLAVKAVPIAAITSLDGVSRADWWSLHLRQPLREPENLTRRLEKCPDILASDGAGSLYAVDAGVLWRIDPEGQTTNQLTDTTDINIDGFAEHSVLAEADHDGVRRLAILGRKGLGRELGVVTVSGTQVTIQSVRYPTAYARPVSYRWQTNRALFTSGDEDVGPLLWESETARSTTILTLNNHLESIARAEERWIDYVGADGDSLLALVLLPPGYKAGRRYPVVTWVYGGFVFQGRSLEGGIAHFVNISQGSWLALQLFTSHGYVVLLPSMPLRQANDSSPDPYIETSKGVMPALTRIIDLGIADPSRLALLGHSAGGYSVYSLVTQTHRFRAAIAIAGFTDLVSWYGSFTTGRRYGEAPHQYYYAPLLLEGGFMNTSLYHDPARYMRNSPLSYVGHVTTPLLLIHGDLDGIPIQQAEEFFTALHRLGRPARFIRYWGEGHNFQSPANIANLWDQIFTWLDRYVCSKDSPCQPAS